MMAMMRNKKCVVALSVLALALVAAGVFFCLRLQDAKAAKTEPEPVCGVYFSKEIIVPISGGVGYTITIDESRLYEMNLCMKQQRAVTDMIITDLQTKKDIYQIMAVDVEIKGQGIKLDKGQYYLSFTHLVDLPMLEDYIGQAGYELDQATTDGLRAALPEVVDPDAQRPFSFEFELW